MSPRPRKATDDEVFLAAQRVMGRLGPAELTLADIAAEAGITAGALVQRFGSKRGLMLALMERFAGGGADLFAALRRQHRSPLAAIRAYAGCMAGMASSHAALVRNLSYLMVDLSDPDFRRHLAKAARATRAELQALVKEAVRCGELTAAAEPRVLARVIEAIISGSMLSWAHHQEGAAARWMRADLNAVLRPYLT